MVNPPEENSNNWRSKEGTVPSFIKPLVVAQPKYKQPTKQAQEIEQSPSKTGWRDSQEWLGWGVDRSAEGTRDGPSTGSQKRKHWQPKVQAQQDHSPSGGTLRPPRGSTRVVYGGGEIAKQAAEKQWLQENDLASCVGRAGGLPAPTKKGWCPSCHLVSARCRCAPPGVRRGYHT
jgi:hypothetical protein